MLDINGDIGEGFGIYDPFEDEKLLDFLTSCNIACGLHAGDYNTMANVVKMAIEKGVKIGAHPGYDDIKGFGRRNIAFTNDEIVNMVIYQVGALDGFVKIQGGVLNHVKLHGALYNEAAKNSELTEKIVKALLKLNKDIKYVTLSGSVGYMKAQELGIITLAEGFADRGYTKDGALSPRGSEGAVIHDSELIVERVKCMTEGKPINSVDGSQVTVKADTICVHGDNPQAFEILKSLKEII